MRLLIIKVIMSGLELAATFTGQVEETNILPLPPSTLLQKDKSESVIKIEIADNVDGEEK
jgi:hypothetical protein